MCFCAFHWLGAEVLTQDYVFTGWATAELSMTRLLPLWVGARGMEFDWKYMQMSFDANISLVINYLCIDLHVYAIQGLPLQYLGKGILPFFSWHLIYTQRQ